MIIHKKRFSKRWNFTEGCKYFNNNFFLKNYSITACVKWKAEEKWQVSCRGRCWQQTDLLSEALSLFLFLPLDGRQTLQTQASSPSFDPFGSLMNSVWQIIWKKKLDCENWYYRLLFELHIYWKKISHFCNCVYVSHIIITITIKYLSRFF